MSHKLGAVREAPIRTPESLVLTLTIWVKPVTPFSDQLSQACTRGVEISTNKDQSFRVGLEIEGIPLFHCKGDLTSIGPSWKR